MIFIYNLLEFILLMLNVVAFVLFSYDKLLANKHLRRIPESVLLSVSMLGGSVGSVLGMLIFRHKIAKKSFIVKISIIIVLQIAILFYWKR